MRIPRAAYFVLLFVMIATLCCQGSGQQDRAPGVAGSFYPSNAAELSKYVDSQLANADSPKVPGFIVGIVAPHAGYQFSGGVAAHSYSLVKGKNYKRVVLIGPSHYAAFGYSSVYDGQSYSTPLGKVPVDQEFARKLAKSAGSIRMSGTGHTIKAQSEHSLEVQLPFLQRALGEFQLVPIVMGDQSYEASRDLGMALAKLLRNDNETLLVASSDLSHYHSYAEAVRKDRSLLNAVVNDDFLTVSRNLQAGTWEACGGAPIVTVMIAAQRLGADAPKLLQYRNSGDVTGDKSRVVGYSSIVFVKGAGKEKKASADKVSLTDAQRKLLLEIARRSVEKAVRERSSYDPPAPGDETLLLERGAFVTLTKRGELRGCIGYVTPDYPLYIAIRDTARLAALRDPRFPPVRPEELPELQYEISVLSPFVHVLDTRAIRVGEDGLLIRRGREEGLLLPQVPVEQKWDRRTFLDEVALKAGLPRDAWQDEKSDLFSFTAVVFSDHDPTSRKK